jgi:hypothetical protein
MFYVEPFPDCIGDMAEFIWGHQDIGCAQDIRLRYPKDDKHGEACAPHIHAQLVWPNDRSLPNEWIIGKDYHEYQGRIYVDIEKAAAL